MKKVGILTLNGYFNYGNRLQNYALQETLNSLGMAVETIIVDRNKKINNEKSKENIDKFQTLTVRKAINKTLNLVQKKRNMKYEKGRTENFKKFTTRYITETDFSISDSNIPNDLNKRYDYFVIGSDQVWNPNLINGSSIFFSAFAPEEKRIAYVPSFGISNIPEEFIEEYKLWLSQMNFLSVREEAVQK